MTHGHADMCEREEAVAAVLDLRGAALAGQSVERVDVADVAGRVLAEDVVAGRALPERSHATMDGYAFDATEAYPLTVVDGEVFPEDDPPSLDAGEAVHVATGAPLPPEANAVLKREEATVADGQLRGADVEPGTYTYRRASNVAEGETVYAAGERLAPRDALLLGDLGVESVPVRARFRVGLLATGTEIHEGRQADLDSPMLAGLLGRWGHEAVYEGTVPDRADRVRDRVESLAREYDVVVTTGGTSVGEKDHVVRVLEDLGDVRFHRVRVRPGKPLAAASLPDHDAVALAVPGKPVGAHTVATLVCRPFFTGERRLPTVEATFARDVDVGAAGFEYAIPVVLDDGEAMPLGHVDSALDVYGGTFDPSVLSSSTRAVRADGFVLTRTGLSAGETVRVVPYPVVE